MILLDTSVIIDARDPASQFHSWAIDQLSSAISGEGAAANTVVLAEAAVRAEVPAAVAAGLSAIGVKLVELPVSAALPAAQGFAVYLERRKAEGTSSGSKTPLPDFFIGAHAQAEKLKLLTRDPARVRTYFPGVELICPPEQ